MRYNLENGVDPSMPKGTFVDSATYDALEAALDWALKGGIGFDLTGRTLFVWSDGTTSEVREIAVPPALAVVIAEARARLCPP
jgi:hypothetical protein